MTYHAHADAKFVEDCVRSMAEASVEALADLGDDAVVHMKQSNDESIHQHNAHAEREVTLGQLRDELSEHSTPETLVFRTSILYRREPLQRERCRSQQYGRRLRLDFLSPVPAVQLWRADRFRFGPVFFERLADIGSEIGVFHVDDAKVSSRPSGCGTSIQTSTPSSSSNVVLMFGLARAL